MNNAGLPGTGLGGLLYVGLALFMPLAELHRTLRGRSSRERWRQVGTQFALACGILVSLVGTGLLFLRLIDSPSPFGVAGPALLLSPVVLAAALLAVLVAVLRVWAWVHLSRQQSD
ncbi:MAG: hypothetical protein JWN84_4429 [Nocardioides sp.]|nr:hypothetical protein [Nocardioides sp.]